MTPEEKALKKKERNAAICAYYVAGHKVKACASLFKMTRQGIVLILQAGGVWTPYIKGPRTKFLGVNVSAETKDALKALADAEGESLSKFTSDVLDDAVGRTE